MRREFTTALQSNQKAFGLSLPANEKERLANYFELVQQHNPLLHLVAPSSGEEFAVRHVLESLALLRYLPQNAVFADVGTGAGLPSIPCLIVRSDLRAVLIESKIKKSEFLAEAIESLGLGERAAVINKQFDEADPGDAQFITCRALDKFIEKLPRLIKWSRGRRLLFFGGPNLREALKKQKLSFEEELLPLSERRFLFIGN